MNKFLRMASLGATVAALTLTATPAAAFGLVNATSNANAHVKIMKGLVLTSTRNLDDGAGVAFSLRLHGMPRQRLSG